MGARAESDHVGFSDELRLRESRIARKKKAGHYDAGGFSVSIFARIKKKRATSVALMVAIRSGNYRPRLMKAALTIAPGGGGIPTSVRKRKAASGAIETRLGLGGFLRRGGVRGRRFRLRNGLGTFALVVIVAGPARVRLFAVGTKFRAHRNPLAYRDARSERLDVALLRPMGL